MKKLKDHEVTERIGIKLKLERIRHGYNQSQVANFTGLDQSDLSKIEKGSLQINFRNLNILFNFYEITYDYFFRDFNTFDLEEKRNLFSKSKKS